MQHRAPDVVSFDLVQLLANVGRGAVRARVVDWRLLGTSLEAPESRAESPAS